LRVGPVAALRSPQAATRCGAVKGSEMTPQCFLEAIETVGRCLGAIFAVLQVLPSHGDGCKEIGCKN
jgi:hypothetical protein